MRCKDVDEWAGWGCRRGEDCRELEQGRCLELSWDQIRRAVFDTVLVLDRQGRPGYVFCCSSLAQCTAAESIVCVCQRRAIEEDCSIAQRGMSRGEVMSARV
jgi:hypothetical protein